MDSARSTAWRLLNTVTKYVDHERRARSNEYRMDSSWFVFVSSGEHNESNFI